MSQNYKTPEEILKDLDNVSPLELPNYLMGCEFYDQSDALKTLEEAEAKFKKEGGTARAMLEVLLRSTADSAGLCLVRYANFGLYRSLVKTRTTEFSTCVENALNFQYEKEYTQPSNTVHDSLKQDLLQRDVIRHPQNGDAVKLDVREGGYQGGKNYRANGMNQDFKERQSADGKTIKNIDGENLFLNKNDANGMRSKVAEADHIIPLETIHNNTKFFIERYVDLDSTDEHGRNKL